MTPIYNNGELIWGQLPDTIFIKSQGENFELQGMCHLFFSRELVRNMIVLGIVDKSLSSNENRYNK